MNPTGESGRINSIGLDTCFIDLDGVVADFYAGVYQHLKEEYRGFDDPYIRIDNWGTRLTDLPEMKKYQRDIHWLMKDASFWRSLPKTSDGDSIVKVCQSYDWKVAFLTSPGNFHSFPAAAEGKIKWVEQTYPDIPVFIGKEKHFMAAPTKFLIDDNPKICLDFVDAGGNAWLVPRRWNVKYSTDTMKEVRSYSDLRDAGLGSLDSVRVDQILAGILCKKERQNARHEAV